MSDKLKVILLGAGVALVVAWVVAYFAAAPTHTTVKEVIREVISGGELGGEIGNMSIFRDGAAFTTRSGGGAVLRGDGMRFLTSTTTVCNLVSPASTSTWMDLNIAFSRNATTAVRELIIATSTLNFATTSVVLYGSLMAIPA